MKGPLVKPLNKLEISACSRVGVGLVSLFWLLFPLLLYALHGDIKKDMF